MRRLLVVRDGGESRGKDGRMRETASGARVCDRKERVNETVWEKRLCVTLRGGRNVCVCEGERVYRVGGGGSNRDLGEATERFPGQ